MEFFGLNVGDILLRLGLGCGIGFCIGLTGVGGGVLGLQAMTLGLGMDPVRAVGTTSLYIFLTNISASFHHARLGNIAWNAAVRILAGAVPANLFVAMWISRQGENEAFKHALELFIIGVVFFSIGLMVLNALKRAERNERTLASRIQGHWLLRNGLGVGLGVVIGGLIGATSVGGGVLIVPILIIVFGLCACRTVGSSIFIAMVLTFMTALIYGKGGELDIRSAVIMAVGSLSGGRYGSRLSVKLPDRHLMWIMIVLILAAAILMLCRHGR